jgi:tyrosine-protein phosphatase non-receptor type 14/21
VLEGKLACSKEQAILLAAYSLQAEFGDHDPERHTVEYLKEFALVPQGSPQATYSQERYTHS